MLTINLPFSQWEYKISGVYKIEFDDGCFYIGASTDMRSRASSWSGVFTDSSKLVAGETIGTLIVDKIREGVSANFNIVELCHPSDVKNKEAYYLFENKDNKQMLSSCDTGSWKPVLQYKIDGLFIKKHVSTGAAAKFVGCKIGRVQEVLNGQRKAVHGMTFIYEHNYHNRRREIINRRKFKREPKNGRDVLIVDVDGNELNRFKQIKESAAYINVDIKSVVAVLSGITKSTKGFILKYA